MFPIAESDTATSGLDASNPNEVSHFQPRHANL